MPHRPADDWVRLRDASVAERFGTLRPKIKPLTPNQDLYIRTMESHTVTLASGPAGTGKTFLACYQAAKLLASESIERIVLTRPLVECDEKLGFLPGSFEEKVDPYMAPLFDALQSMMDAKDIGDHRRAGSIEVAPLALMRGRTFRRAFVVLDEANNATRGQIRMLLTRLGEGSRIVVCGDPTQSDLKGREVNPFAWAMDRLGGHHEIGIVKMGRSDVVRHPLVAWMDERLMGD